VLEVINKTNIDGVAISSLLHYDALYTVGKLTKKGNNDFLKANLLKQKSVNVLKKLKIFLNNSGMNVRI
jgi:hypothetical protein